MKWLAHETGFYLASVRPTTAVFRVRHQREIFTFGVAMVEERLRLYAISKIEFPPGRVPPRIVGTLRELNQRMEEFDFDVLDGDEDSNVALTAFVGPDKLTPSLLKSAVSQMIPRIAAFDEWFMENYG
jgi:hypothetical protein